MLANFLRREQASPAKPHIAEPAEPAEPGAGAPCSPAKPEFKDTLNSADQSDPRRLPRSTARWAPLLGRAHGPGPRTRGASSRSPTSGADGAGARGCCPRQGPPVPGGEAALRPLPGPPLACAPLPSLFSERNESFIMETRASLEEKPVRLVIRTWVSPAQNFRCLIHKSCHPCKPPDFIMNNSSSLN